MHEVVGGRYQRRSRDAVSYGNLDVSSLVPGGFVPERLALLQICDISEAGRKGPLDAAVVD